MQEGKQRARGGVSSMTGWPATRDPFCKHKHKPPVLCRVPRAVSETSLGSALTSWRVRAVNGAVSCETPVPHETGPLPLVEAAALH